MKRILALVFALSMALSLCACGTNSSQPAPAESGTSGTSDGKDFTLRVGMECAYAPYNWTQTDDSNGAVPIANVSGSYANGYDVMIAKKICEANNWNLEIYSIAWDSLTPALQSDTIDAAIAGQSMTKERMAEVDMAGPYYYATIVCVTKSDSKFADAKGIRDLAGGSCTSQSGTIWYDTCLPQISGAKIQSAAETAPAMIMALETGTVDFICTDIPTAKGAVATYPDLKTLDFSGTGGDFQFASDEERAENVNIGISVKKGNTDLQDSMNKVLQAMTKDDFDALMNDAISVKPAI